MEKNPLKARKTWVFVAVLFGYLLVCWYGQQFHSNTEKLVGDEGTYVRYAEELIAWVSSGGAHEFNTDITMYSGPGFPLFLSPWIFLGFSFPAIKLLNAFLIVGGSALLCQTLGSFLSKRSALIISLLTILHPKLIWHSSMIVTEPYAFFLSSLLGWIVLRPKLEHRPIQWFFAAVVLSQIILTKVLFAYVTITLLLVFAAWRLLSKNRDTSPPVIICAGSLVLCGPFLLHTYGETGKPFYWLHSGGTNLYWMSTPYPNELGDWMGDNLEGLRQRSAEGHVEFVFDNHEEFFRTLPLDNTVERDLLFKRVGWRNIRSHPVKFAKNIVANLSRIYTDHPNTYKNESFGRIGWVDIVVGAPLLIATGVGLFLALVHLKQIPTPMLFVLLLFLVFIAGLAPLASFGRMLVPALPLMAISLPYIFKNFAWEQFLGNVADSNVIGKT